MTTPSLTGWIEIDGKLLGPDAIEAILRTSPEQVLRFGGEFFLKWDGCSARDHFGIMEGTGQKGMLICNGEMKGEINPAPMEMPLEEAIVTAVKLRSDEGVVALSGGIDSALVAYLAQRECVAVGVEGSHDLKQARHAAETLGLSCAYATITEDEIASALPEVVATIPKKDPVNTGIALTLYFIARWAGEHGYHRIITGQGADELFGGYTRYLETSTLEADLERDFAGLEGQARRDQAVAALYGAYLSMPYLDTRVVRAARAIPATEKVKDGRRKIPLRTVAERYIPQDLAWYEKKAMQYGSGVYPTLRKLARKNGYKTSMQDYIDQIIRVEHGH
ncbi:MAG: asparagine synthase C-terminal domain-containing protein [Methanoregula sp.]|jgi:asparagine synthase (glutamine-hydrolysing)|uniref:asparagine synthase C-terminal domain-containing protein n=1 Tax=Methanoregula sp. TaxID=2052170 RepID=UPI0025F7D7F8|nr:asparagine synthase-related protein [Methanoregula sp.]MCK9630777.1 asparagine synthase C-terminal domain-containing protein [Methanoregula sp.]